MKQSIAVLSMCWLVMNLGVAKATTIDFEQFNVGDNLATVNAALAPLGISFDAAFPSTFEVVVDPGDAGNKVIRAQPFGASGAVDIVANFTVPVQSVGGEFVTNPDPVTVIVLEGWTANQVASAVNVAEFAFSTFANSATGTLGLVWSDVFGPPSLMRAASFSVASGGAPSFNYIDNVTFVLVPEPSSLVLVAIGLLGVSGWRRKVA